MISVACPSCELFMDIEENEPNTEWECPTCGAAFLVEENNDQTLRLVVTEAGARTPAPELSVNRRQSSSRRRRKLVTTVVPREPSQNSPPISGLEGLTDDEIVRELNGGARFVVYRSCLSLIILSFRLDSPVHFVRANESTVWHGMYYTMISLAAGWWGIPWGPIWTVACVATNLAGGRDVTTDVLAAMPRWRRAY